MAASPWPGRHRHRCRAPRHRSLADGRAVGRAPPRALRRASSLRLVSPPRRLRACWNTFDLRAARSTAGAARAQRTRAGVERAALLPRRALAEAAVPTTPPRRNVHRRGPCAAPSQLRSRGPRGRMARRRPRSAAAGRLGSPRESARIPPGQHRRLAAAYCASAIATQPLHGTIALPQARRPSTPSHRLGRKDREAVASPQCQENMRLSAVRYRQGRRERPEGELDSQTSELAGDPTPMPRWLPIARPCSIHLPADRPLLQLTGACVSLLLTHRALPFASSASKDEDVPPARRLRHQGQGHHRRLRAELRSSFTAPSDGFICAASERRRAASTRRRLARMGRLRASAPQISPATTTGSPPPRARRRRRSTPLPLRPAGTSPP